MEIMFLEAPFTGTVELCKKTIDYLKKNKIRNVGLYASVQFVNQLKTVEEQLQCLNITIISSHADRTHVPKQILGCDNDKNSLHLSDKQKEQIQLYLYIGDGKFHPLALVYAQRGEKKPKEVICNDPIAKDLTIMAVDDIKTMLARYRGSLLKFITAKTVGILITIKPGQEHFKPALELEKQYPDKKFYFFVDNVISFDQLENFNFIDVWVNTACPRVGFDDQEKFIKGVVNLHDAVHAVEMIDEPRNNE